MLRPPDPTPPPPVPPDDPLVRYRGRRVPRTSLSSQKNYGKEDQVTSGGSKVVVHGLGTVVEVGVLLTTLEFRVYV